METDAASEHKVPYTTVTGTNHLTKDGALDCPAPAVWGNTQRSGLNSRRAAGPPDGWARGDRDSRQGSRVHPLAVRGAGAREGTATQAADGIDEAAVHCRAEAEVSGKLEAQERRCIFVNTGPKTIAVHLQAEHTLVNHVQDQVAAREGIATEHQRLMYAGKQLISPEKTTA